MNEKFKHLGFYPADILLPKDADMTKWAVVACDQFTSQPEYWQAVEETVGDAPSTLRLILPEAKLNEPDVDEHIAGINAAMQDYLDRGIFRTLADSLIYIEREQSDGKIREGYFPKTGEPDYIDVVPGTHASADFLAHLAFNHFVLNVPYYREMYRLSDHKMSLSRMTLVNWLAKGAAFTSALIERLKDRAMVKDSILNCDETWCKVKMNRHFLKKYVWCLVNKEQKIVIYCYEDGSRGRKVLKGILKDRQVKALQSDGYNVYMYIDKELVDTEHLCCLAHARAKFVYAYEQGDDPDAKYLIDCFGELYRLEDTYKLSGLSAQEITRCRHSLRTKEIIGRIRSKLDVLLSPTHPPRGELMDKAVNYLQVFWKQLFAYLNDGRYDIDNSIAERFIRPLAGERKNSLFFVGSRMANVSAAYHTLLSTCRMNGLSALEYLKKFFHEIVKGRKDYENLLPMTIGINTNKY